MTPEKYRRGAVAAVVRYTTTPSPLGRMLIAATDRGICAIQFADSDGELQQGLMREFPFAVRRRDDAALAEWKMSLGRLMTGQDPHPSLPLDIRATAFQRRVGNVCRRFRAEKRVLTALWRKRSACLRRRGRWLGPVRRIRSRLRFPATGWFAKMAGWAAIVLGDGAEGTAAGAEENSGC